MQCILCEKPSAAKNYAKALGGAKGMFNGEDYEIVCSVGHIFSMPRPEEQVKSFLKDRYKSWDEEYLPWDYRDIEFKKELTKGFEDTFAKIKKVADKCDKFVIATDDDPTGEGTLLANEIIEALNLKDVTYYRSFHVDESEKEIQKAMKTLKCLGKNPKDDPDFKKSDFRNKWDFLSMQWTRLFTAEGDGSSLLRQGRLKSYMVFAVGEQIKAINEYKKIPFYQNRYKDENGNIYTSKKAAMFKDKKDVPIHKLHDSTVTLDKEERKYKAPPALYDLNVLSASLAACGYKTKQIIDTYQKMYEDHVVSYPRTEDKTITEEQFKEFLTIADKVADVVGIDKALLTHRSPRATHVINQGSHGANRPSNNVPSSLNDLKKYGDCAPEIYRFVARNSLAMLCEDYEYNHQEGHVTDFPDFIGSVNVPVKKGYKEIFDDEKLDPTKCLGKTAKPFVYEGFPPKPAWPTAKWLANHLKKNDVGTGSTRASIYSDVTDESQKCPLLVDTKGKITMTKYGEMSYTLLEGTHIGNVKLTESLQEQMRNVAKGAEPEKYLELVEKLVAEDMAKVRENAKKLKDEYKRLLCPKCHKPLQHYEWGYRCSDNATDDAKCSFFASYNMFGGKLSDDEMRELLSKGKLSKEKTFVSSSSGKKYNASLKIEEGNIKLDFGKVEKAKTTKSKAKPGGVKCPKCSKFAVITKYGIKCTNKECDFKIYRTIAGNELTDEQMKTLVEKGKNRKNIWF